jgi:uncharacterized protein YndB with AHSA1/START domain
MSIITTITFRFVTSADPATAWQALTDDPGHFSGLTVESDWLEGSTIRLCAGAMAIEGEVLCSVPGQRLSHTLGDLPGQPEVYVTWALAGAPGGTVVDLYVDEVGAGRFGSGGRDQDLADMADAWQPVVDAVRVAILRCTR